MKLLYSPSIAAPLLAGLLAASISSSRAGFTNTQEQAAAAAASADQKARGDDALFTREFTREMNKMRHAEPSPAPRAPEAPASSNKAFLNPSALLEDIWLKVDAAVAPNLKRMLHPVNATIWEGTPANPQEFPDCVVITPAANRPDDFCCSGILLSPDVVITAAHCPNPCLRYVTFGTDVRHPTSVAAVRKVWPHEHYRPATHSNDICILILKEKVAIPFRPVAPKSLVDQSPSLLIVGFGMTNDSPDSKGIQCKGSAPIVPGTCVNDTMNQPFGCNPEIEIVAKAPIVTNDTCFADSGGPAYVTNYDGKLYVAALASRAIGTAPPKKCGYGTDYVRLEPFLPWIRTNAARFNATPPP